jgi:hypothetical protein
MLSLLST